MKTKIRIALAATLLSATLVSANAAHADNSVAGALIGGSTGVLIGQSIGGRDGALIGGLFGAAAGVAIANDRRGNYGDYSYRSGYYREPVVAYAPQPVYYRQPVVYAPATIYYEHHDRGWGHRRWERERFHQESHRDRDGGRDWRR